MNRLKGLLLNALVSLQGRKELRLLRRACLDPRCTSIATLRQILTFARDTVYGREHHFDKILEASTDEELLARYRKEVAASEYEDYIPYVERHKHGEADILFPGRPVLYASTSGSTAEPKWIPYSQRYLHSVYGRMTRLWIYSFVRNRPKVLAGKAFLIVGKVEDGRAPDGTVYGSASGMTRHDTPGFIKRLYTNPPSAYAIADYTARYYVLMRMAIEHDVSIIVTANPSTIVELMSNATAHYDEYVADIERGTIKKELDIEPGLRAELEAQLRPNPQRAAFLRRLKEQYGQVLPKHYWPHFQLLNTWKCGNTRIYIDNFKDSFPPQTLHQELGYFATECRFGLALDGQSDNSVLFPHMHLYEFVHEEELESPNPTFLLADELEEGQRYCPYVTTFSGLYRYNMRDLVEAGQRFGQMPTVHLVQKTHGIVSLTGEKLYEQQFIEAVRIAEEQTGMHTLFHIGFAAPKESRYHFYFEFADQSVSQQQADRLTEAVDLQLQQMNIEYAAKRESLRLKAPVGHRLAEQSFARFKEQSIKAGARDGQFKLGLLMQNEQRHDRIKQLILE